MKRPRLAIAGLSGCSGCQLSLLNCETELSLLLEQIECQFFPLAISPAHLKDAYAMALVEGCCTSSHDELLLRELRKRSRRLIALGTCAAWGGVAAMANDRPRAQLRRQIYGNQPTLDDGTPRPLSAVVEVDATVHGCPPEPTELLALLADLLRGTLPIQGSGPVCSDCRMRENLCLLQERNLLCLGPLTLGGCQARCPSRGVPCEGCRGPAPEANVAEALFIYRQKGFDESDVWGRLRRFCPEWKHDQRA